MIEGRIEVTLRRGRRRKQLLDVIEENWNRQQSIALVLEEAMDLRTALSRAIAQLLVVISKVSTEHFGPIS